MGKSAKSAKENAAYKVLRLVGEKEFQVSIDDFSEQ